MSIYIEYIYIYKTGGQNTGGIAIPCAGLRRLAAKPWCWARKSQPNMPSRARLKQERCGTGDGGMGMAWKHELHGMCMDGFRCEKWVSEGKSTWTEN